MLDHHTSYRWQDHVITPRRAALNLIATAMIVATVGVAGVIDARSPDAATSVAVATERTPTLAQSVKRMVPHRVSDWLRRC
jgi:hypothetical protein